MSNIENTLKERGAIHGDFKSNAEISQYLKAACGHYVERLTKEEREALDMILHKIARVLTSRRRNKDNWRDIAGYATLALNALDTYPDSVDIKTSILSQDEKGNWREEV